MKWVWLWSDVLIYILIIAIAIMVFNLSRKRHFRQAWRQVFSNPLAVSAAVILSVFLIIGLLDSIHFRFALHSHQKSTVTHYSSKVTSVLDVLMAPLGQDFEKTYSAPFSWHLFVKAFKSNGVAQQVYPHLKYVNKNIQSKAMVWQSIIKNIITAMGWVILIMMGIMTGIILILKTRWRESIKNIIKKIKDWRAFFPMACVFEYAIYCTECNTHQLFFISRVSYLWDGQSRPRCFLSGG